MSSYLVAEAVSQSGAEAVQVVATELIQTDNRFGDAEFLAGPTKECAQAVLLPLLGKGIVPVVTGFIGRAPDGRTTTLGRGGSDYTASILGLSLGAKQIEIWKEVDGIMTTDPRIVPDAKVVPELSFEEACELAYFGAKVLHPKTILPAIEAEIPVKVLNTFHPEAPGTTIVANFLERKMKSHTVEAFSFKKHITIIHMRSPEFFDGNGLMARIFALFEQHKTSVDVIATSVVSVSLTIDDETNLEPLVAELSALGSVSIERDKAIVCAVGGSVNAAGVAGEMFTALGKAGIPVEMISQAASGVSTTFVVEERDAERAIKVLHETYIGK
jgi:aspartate kinase